ncbi:formate dehydrogenase subunit delta [Maritimibacter alkaliphilus]|uniref:formate dehydrogenase subunit delta n=1 Tax=Maritimibacter alkaliphilus TaxID=404236 RepID=UPI001C93F5E1|nr:formate dehydrogenase subunit delta [Maritimibacter alkaliphilus]MBY6088821.1 formate dehydrogenase subunit delta [Maritimibacter alkaliphilus]
MSHDKLIYMANQIATFFETQPGSDQAEHVADHLNDFWEPRMRAQLLAMVARGEAEGLRPLARSAMAHVRAPAEQAD